MRFYEIENAVLIWGPVSGEGLLHIRQRGWFFIVPENRPFMLGLKHNVPRLKKNNMRFVYCNDSALGLLFSQGKIYKTVVFCKEKRENEFVAIAGSLYVILLSRLHQVEVEVLAAPTSSFKLVDDAATLGGKRFILDEPCADYIVSPDDELIPEEFLK